MSYTKVALAFGTVALAVATAASTYHFQITDPAWVGGTELRPGDYKIDVEGNKAVIKSGKNNVAEAPAKAETGDKKYAYTSVDLASDGGKSMLKEIRIGGTNTRIVFEPRGAPGSE